jgi:voltage-dependent calcium channel
MDANSLSPRPSAIATGLASGSAPPSPSLNPPTGYSSAGFTRRRTSWGNKADAGTDPLQFDLPLKSALPTSDPLSSSKSVGGTMGNGGGSAKSSPRPLFIPPGDPFSSPPDDQPPLREFPFSASAKRYPSITSISSSFSTSQPGASSAALISPDYAEENRVFDDDVRLTAHIGGGVTEQGWDSEQTFAADAERVAASPGMRVRYDTSPSPLKKTGTVLKNITKSLRRVSLRVVNLASAGLENQIRLPDDDGVNLVGSGFDNGDESFPDLGKLPPIRGRTLGFLGPTNRLRQALFRFMVHPCVLICLIPRFLINQQMDRACHSIVDHFQYHRPCHSSLSFTQCDTTTC